ncbi:amidohydrolase family protein [uncultured Microbacterium sp.]|uniref:amidohydrolase family protein n=1 Tax=uncultured Microbacterium sp. TaxID=191216 RepID=UPI0035CA0637
MTSATITNVRVFDGGLLSALTSVEINGESISAVGAAPRGEIIDGGGGVLMPGLIDSHVHIDDAGQLQQLLAYGVTTALDMANANPRVTDSLRNLPGLPQLFGAGLAASAPGGVHTKKMGYPQHSAVQSPSDAERFVADRVRDGSDYIKIIVEDPKMPGTASLPPATLAALVDAAHGVALIVIAHAVTSAAVDLATDAGADVITHAPVNRSLTAQEAGILAARDAAIVPTLTMLQGTTRVINARRVFRMLRRLRIAPPVEYANARARVAVARAAGVAIVVGTDANNDKAAPWNPDYGSSLHDELELLVDAGLTPAEALTAATATAARVFGLSDRGAVHAGFRADLLLLDGDPTADIRATRSIKGVWIDGRKLI